MTAQKEETVLVQLAGRTIEVRRPSDGALVVLARIGRGIPSSSFDPAQLSDEARARLIHNLGTVGKVLESMIVSEADRDWLDDVMVSGEVTPEQAFGVVKDAAEALNAGAAPAKKAAAPVRRRR